MTTTALKEVAVSKAVISNRSGILKNLDKKVIQKIEYHIPGQFMGNILLVKSNNEGNHPC